MVTYHHVFLMLLHCLTFGTLLAAQGNKTLAVHELDLLFSDTTYEFVGFVLEGEIVEDSIPVGYSIRPQRSGDYLSDPVHHMLFDTHSLQSMCEVEH